MVITWMELKDARALRGWTQAQLAEAVGVHQKTIVNWEANGVPPKSEYKVRRAMPQEVRYVDYVSHAGAAGADPMQFDEWLAADEENQAYWEAVEADREEDGRPSSEREFQHDPDYDIDREQERYEHRLDRTNTLSSFSSQELLVELGRRITQLEHRDSVGGPSDDDHEVDLRKEALGLAASDDDTAVNPDRQP